MNKERLSWLVTQYMADAATPQELQELTSLVHAGTEQELFKTVMASMMEQEQPVAPAQEALWEQMVQQIVSIDKPAPRQPARLVRFYKWAAAAVVLVFAGLALYYYLVPAKRSSTPATGTPLAYNVISTAKSKLSQVVLPDGSHVWLNAASSLRYPVAFNEKERVVELSGEAWFDIQHADKIPFLIRSGSITTAVLGTAFDVRAYPDQQSMIVSVQRGVVQIRSGDKTLTTLTKGQQVRVKPDTSFTRHTVDTLSIAAWKQGNLLYKDETVKDIVADLQRVFNHSIIIKRSSLQQEMITVSFNKGTGIRQALEIICRITDARLTEQQGTFIIE